VGREKELAAIRERLGDPLCRLLTLVGPGGSGKTRLAVESAAQALKGFRDGVHFVPLAPLESAEAVVSAVARAVGLSFVRRAGEGPPAEPRQQLLDYLRHRTTLLLLDNAEHLLPDDQRGLVALIGQVLQAAPSVKVMVTSRAALRLQSEHLFHVGSLALLQELPAPLNQWHVVASATEYSALRLFVSAAARVCPDFTLASGNLPHVARICSQVAGMPLGILLAAAWTRMLSPAEISAAITAEMPAERSGSMAPESSTLEGQGLDFLASDASGMPERHRSMRAVFDHSWRLLSERERQLLQGMSVFRGDFARGAAQEVTGATLHELARLVDMSLLQHIQAPTPMAPGPQSLLPEPLSLDFADLDEMARELGLEEWLPGTLGSSSWTEALAPQSPPAESRYEMHELLRQYAAERLSQSADRGEGVRDRHAAYYVRELQRWQTELQGPRRRRAIDEMEIEFAHLRTAWERLAQRLLVCGLDQALSAVGSFSYFSGRTAEAAALFRSAAERFEAADRIHAGTPGSSLRVWSRIQSWRCLLANQGATHLLQRALDLLDRPEAAAEDTRRERAFALWLMGMRTTTQDPKRSGRLVEHAVALFEGAGYRWEANFPMGYLSLWAAGRGRFDEARTWIERRLAICSETGDLAGVALSLTSLAGIACHQGRLDEAARTTHRALALFSRVGGRREMADIPRGSAYVLIHCGRSAECIELLDRALTTSSDLGDTFLVGSVHRHLCMAWALLGKYGRARHHGEAGLAIPRREESKWHITQALLGLGWAALGRAARSGGTEGYEAATELLQECATLSREVQERRYQSTASACLAITARALGQRDTAWKHMHQALRTAIDIRYHHSAVFALSAVSLLLADAGQVERAVELYALASRSPFVANSRWFEDAVGRHILIAAATLPPEAAAAARQRGQQRDVWATANECLGATDAHTEDEGCSAATAPTPLSTDPPHGR
jgi:predicted ATPase